MPMTKQFLTFTVSSKHEYICYSTVYIVLWYSNSLTNRQNQFGKKLDNVYKQGVTGLCSSNTCLHHGTHIQLHCSSFNYNNALIQRVLTNGHNAENAYSELQSLVRCLAFKLKTLTRSANQTVQLMFCFVCSVLSFQYTSNVASCCLAMSGSFLHK